MTKLKIAMAIVLMLLFLIAPAFTGFLLLAFFMYAVADVIVDEIFGEKDEL
jgi:hypothetical protein